MKRTQILNLLRESVAEVNEQLPPGSELVFAEDTSLQPGASGLDSLGTVNLHAAIEERLESQTGVSLSLAEETESFAGEDPWHSVGALADFLTERVRVLRSGDPEADGF